MAIEAFENSIKYYPEYDQPYYYLSLIYKKNGKIEESKSYYEKATSTKIQSMSLKKIN
ncbi:MAG: tetratricopeptide repeat protein [Ignavibacteria bacterium]|nr:tetratricopeptide repeat protein [Ignavibacteria bacterium]